MSVETQTKIEQLADLAVDLGELISDPDESGADTSGEFIKQARDIAQQIQVIAQGLTAADYDDEYEEGEDDDET